MQVIMSPPPFLLWAFFSLRREFFIDIPLVRIHCIIVMMRWTGLAPWEFEFPFPQRALLARCVARF